MEFLIGLLAISGLAPQERSDWGPRFHTPPSVDEIALAIRPFAHALVLDGPGPRFFQDFEPLKGEETAVAALLMDQPGGKTQTDNADFFVKRGGIKTLSRKGAAIALLTLQTSAPSGGAGHRTSLRGGGPVITLVIPRVSDQAPSLWQILWANVPSNLHVEPNNIGEAMPWLRPTRVSDATGGPTTPLDIHASQAFFGTPRRIRLNFIQNTSQRPCDLFGDVDDVIIQSYVTRPYGANYIHWRHPLSPYYKQRSQDAELLPLHFKSSAVGYRQWIGLVLKSQDELRIPADNIDVFLKDRRREAGIKVGDEHKASILACGYAMDNMKPLDFTEAYLPIITTDTTDGVAVLANHMVKAATYAVSMLTTTLNAALFNGQGKAGNSVFSTASARFWNSTEAEFYKLLQNAASHPEHDPRVDWLFFLRSRVLAIFDSLAPIDDPESLDIKAVVEARSLLLRTLSGKKFYKEAELDPPSQDKPKGRAA